MTLKDFLLNVKTGFSTYVITSCDDENFGAHNLTEGKYFALDTWDVEDEETLIGICEELPSGFMEGEWLEREIVEVDAITPMNAMRSFFEGAGYRGSMDIRGFINIAVQWTHDDAKIWEDEENLAEPMPNNIYGGTSFPIGDKWPYDIAKDDYDRLHELLRAGRDRIITNESWQELRYPNELFFMEAVTNIFQNGCSAFQELTEEQLAEQEAKAKEGTADDRLRVRVKKYAKEIVDAAPTLEALIQFIALCPELSMFVKADRR